MKFIAYCIVGVVAGFAITVAVIIIAERPKNRPPPPDYVIVTDGEKHFRWKRLKDNFVSIYEEETCQEAVAEAWNMYNWEHGQGLQEYLKRRAKEAATNWQRVPDCPPTKGTP